MILPVDEVLALPEPREATAAKWPQGLMGQSVRWGQLTFLPTTANGASFRLEMEAAVQAGSQRPEPTLCSREVLSAAPKGDRIECAFTDGTTILLSRLLASFIHRVDELRFCLGAFDTPAELHIRPPEQDRFRRDILQVQVGYVTQPKKDKRGEYFVSAEPLGKRLGINQVHLRCELQTD